MRILAPRTAVFLFLVACAPGAVHEAVPKNPPPTASPRQVAEQRSAHEIFDALCKKAEAESAHSNPVASSLGDADGLVSLDDSTRVTLEGAVRRVLPVRLRTADVQLTRAHAIEQGRLVEAQVLDSDSSGPSGLSSFVVLVPSKAAPKLLPGRILRAVDFDGDGDVEPLVADCRPLPLFGKDCTFRVWFKKGPVEWSRRLTGAEEPSVTVVSGSPALVVAPADAEPGDLALPKDVAVVRYSRSGANASDGREPYAGEWNGARLRYALELCGQEATHLDAGARKRHLLALGANAAEADAILNAVNGPLPTSEPAADTPPSASTATADPSAAVWNALPRPSVAPCKSPAPGEQARIREEIVARVAASAEARFVDLEGTVDVKFGCSSHGTTPYLVGHDERTKDSTLWEQEIWVHAEGKSERIAAVRSRPRMEWHHLYGLSLGVSGDFDGDGEKETVLAGTDHEQGAVGVDGVAAVFRGRELLAIPTTGHFVVVPLGPTHDGLLLGKSPTSEGETFRWPPELLAFSPKGLEKRPVPVAWTRATRAAREAFGHDPVVKR